MRRLNTLLALVLISTTLQGAPARAATATISMQLNQTPSANNPIITFYGTVKPAKKNVKVSLQILKSGRWASTPFATKSAAVGSWSLVVPASITDTNVKYRVRSTLGGRAIYSKVRNFTYQEVPQIDQNDPLRIIERTGPGGTIHGADVSRWQHPNNELIDFKKMYSAGIRFVIIKASDSRDEADALALKWLLVNRPAAQAAGIMTGFYHYSTLPDVKAPADVIQDAQTQAQKVIWRLASIGGYTDMDLPYALDLENNCVRYSGSTCTKYTDRDTVTLWAKAFLKTLKEKTQRTPILYSYASFLEGAVNRDAELSSYPLWLAHYGIDPGSPTGKPGIKPGGCFVHAWTTAACESQWTIWQYTSCGIAPKYGVPGTRLDLNVFRGSPSAFMELAKGTWVPEITDQMPKNEPTTMAIKSTTATDTNARVKVSAEVFRPDGKPVVTGTVRFYPDPLVTNTPKLKQTITRSTSGAWKLSIAGLTAGTWTGTIGFKDRTGTHALTELPIQFTVAQGEELAPTPTPTPKPTPTKKPAVDSCAKQIKN